jgi:hypothetical protein
MQSRKHILTQAERKINLLKTATYRRRSASKMYKVEFRTFLTEYIRKCYISLKPSLRMYVRKMTLNSVNFLYLHAKDGMSFMGLLLRPVFLHCLPPGLP